MGSLNVDHYNALSEHSNTMDDKRAKNLCRRIRKNEIEVKSYESVMDAVLEKMRGSQASDSVH
jgi:hypothetical protein